MMSHEAGERCILELADILDDCGISFFLMQGTALGAYRDGGFCPTEKDIDIGVLFENLDPFDDLALLRELMDNSFDVEAFCMPFVTPRTIVAWKEYPAAEGRKVVKADIVGLMAHTTLEGREVRYTYGPFRPWDSERYALVHDAITVEPPYRRIELWGRTWNIPEPIGVYLEREYGPDWRIPADDSVSRTRDELFLQRERIWVPNG